MQLEILTKLPCLGKKQPRKFIAWQGELEKFNFQKNETYGSIGFLGMCKEVFIILNDNYHKILVPLRMAFTEPLIFGHRA